MDHELLANHKLTFAIVVLAALVGPSRPYLQQEINIVPVGDGAYLNSHEITATQETVYSRIRTHNSCILGG
ncbi:hypothetical protein BDZ97DRAFT_1816584 [Flammula alnicola]|nr:hypothetical protein BDZ97DRAFT_1816584 [Flammula alnicola]